MKTELMVCYTVKGTNALNSMYEANELMIFPGLSILRLPFFILKCKMKGWIIQSYSWR